LEGFEPKSLNCFSAVGVLVDPPTTLPKSSAPPAPGVFGPFELPNEAKAPEPNPKALDAPAVGEDKDDAEGDMELKGFFVLCEEVSPGLLPRANPRAGGSPPLKVDPFVVGFPVDSESLLELYRTWIRSAQRKRHCGNEVGTKTYFERRVHRLSITKG
jgi:hypothetical protein